MPICWLQIHEIQIQIQFERPLLESIKWTIDVLGKNFQGTEPQEVNRHLLSIFKIRNFNPCNSTFVDLQSSGNLGIIKNQDHKNEIIAFYQELSRKSRVIYQNLNHENFIYSQGLIDKGLLNIHPNFYMGDMGTRFDDKLELKFDDIAFKNMTKPESMILIKNALSAKTLITDINILYLEELEASAKELIKRLSDNL